MLLNPSRLSDLARDDRTREMLKDIIDFFEQKGKTRLKRDDHERVWYQDFLSLVKEKRLFATLLTPSAYGAQDSRWDTWRNCLVNEVLGFYGLHYWYTWQVSILGLGPIWMSRNEVVRRKTAALLEEGGIFAFGMSEKEHGADLYSTEMALRDDGAGGFLARGRKYYIGNGNRASLVSTFGKFAGTDEFVFFAVDSAHGGYECVRNLVNVQSYVAEYALNDYPISQDDILSRGAEAWDAALNTVNIGKFNLGWASIGICTHAFFEAIHHAAHRRLYGQSVTDFPHVKRLLTDAYARLVAMKLFAQRASDYFRSASLEDRRYLLFNPLVKMKVTCQGEEVINLLWDVIAAKGFERDTYFEMATRDVRALPKLEGTVHVNMALVVKFMRNYFFAPQRYLEVPRRDDPQDDVFLFQQGPAKGLAGIRFHSYQKVYDACDLPTVRVFRSQLEAFKQLLMTAPPDEAQGKDIDFLLALGDLFTMVVYGQLILENARITGLDDALLDQIFDVFIRDFSRYALELYSRSTTTPAQMERCLAMVRRAEPDPVRSERVFREHVLALRDAYQMRDG